MRPEVPQVLLQTREAAALGWPQHADHALWGSARRGQRSRRVGCPRARARSLGICPSHA